MKKLIVTSMLLFFASTTGFAADVWITSKIKAVYPLGDGNFVLMFNDSPAACTNTGTPKYLYVTANQNGVTEEGSKKMYAAALTAAASGKDVSALFSDSTSSCYINRLSVVFN